MGAGATNLTASIPVSFGGAHEWSAVSDYPFRVMEQSCVSSSAEILCIGGINGSVATDAVYYYQLAQGQDNGLLFAYSEPIIIVAIIVVFGALLFRKLYD